METSLSPGTEQLLQILLILSAVLLIPVAVGLVVVLFKLAFLIHSANEVVALANNEVTPLLRELRMTVGNIENISRKASSGVQELGSNLSHAMPVIQQGFGSLKAGTSALFSGIGRSFGKS